MIEVRFHGRGGGGAMIAARMLAVALARQGKYVQAFPSFEIERPSAPFEAFLRFDEERIFIRSGIRNPDHLIVLDSRLLKFAETMEGFKGSGWIVVDHPRRPHEMEERERPNGIRMATVDVQRISRSSGARGNHATAAIMAGAFARTTGLCPIDPLAEAAREGAGEIADAAQRATRLGFEEVCFGQ